MSRKLIFWYAEWLLTPLLFVLVLMKNMRLALQDTLEEFDDQIDSHRKIGAQLKEAGK